MQAFFEKRSTWLLVLVCAAIYFQTLWFEFLRIDDDVNVFANPLFLNQGLESLWTFWEQPYERLYIPVTYTLWGFIHAAESIVAPNHFHPGLYHLINVLVHLANGIFVLRIAESLLGNRFGAWVAAFVFLVHPYQVEGVAWVTSFRGLLSTFFALALMEYFVRKRGCFTPAQAVLAIALFALAVLSKPSAVGVLPLLAAVGVGWFAENRKPQLVFLCLCAAVFLPTALLTKSEQPDAISGATIPWTARPAVFADAVSFYLTKAILAWGFSLDYARTPVEVLRHPNLPGFLVTACVIFLVAKIPVQEYRSRGLFLLAGFALALVPVSGLVSFQFQNYSTVADRYVYLPLVALALLAGDLSTRLATKGRAVVAVWLCLLAIESVHLTTFWKDEFSLFERTVELNPRSLFGHNNLGFAYGQRGNWELAVFHYEQAIRLAPQNPIITENLQKARMRLEIQKAL